MFRAGLGLTITQCSVGLKWNMIIKIAQSKFLIQDVEDLILYARPYRAQPSFLSFFHFTYRDQYFLTLLLLVKGPGQIQSGDRGQVKLNFLELLAKRNPLVHCWKLQETGPYTPDIE